MKKSKKQARVNHDFGTQAEIGGQLVRAIDLPASQGDNPIKWLKIFETCSTIVFRC